MLPGYDSVAFAYALARALQKTNTPATGCSAEIFIETS